MNNEVIQRDYSQNSSFVQYFVFHSFAIVFVVSFPDRWVEFSRNSCWLLLVCLAAWFIVCDSIVRFVVLLFAVFLLIWYRVRPILKSSLMISLYFLFCLLFTSHSGGVTDCWGCWALCIQGFWALLFWYSLGS